MMVSFDRPQVDVMSLITSDPEVGCWLLADMSEWPPEMFLSLHGRVCTACLGVMRCGALLSGSALLMRRARWRSWVEV